MRRWAVVFSLIASVVAAGGTTCFGAIKPVPPRQVVNLDGRWEIEQGGMDAIPQAFSHAVVVPGLVDMAQPAFAEVGKTSELREAFWYRRTFKLDGPVPAVAILKIHKAQYGTKVFLNGQAVGEHLPCFTPALLDVKPYLRGAGQTNELVIRLGANRESLPGGMPAGWDFEKYRFIPGIYDSVELILTGAAYVVNVQTAADVQGETVRVVAEVQAGNDACDFTARMDVCEAASGRIVGSAKTSPTHVEARQLTKVNVTMPLEGCRMWTPEDPFLYELKIGTTSDAAEVPVGPEYPFLYKLKIGTTSDAAKVRFGMRSFTFDPEAKRAVLNGKPYYMRGTNVTLYRFFEDAQRGDLPWQPDWVRRLHQKYKTMHWNSIRYCIGFPPELWYDIADEEGFLIQDEFPIWLLSGPEVKTLVRDKLASSTASSGPEIINAEELASEYTEWMRERWNHPCVVIWDAQNESRTKETGKAIQAVRGLDLSNRPWENGWAEPQAATDCVESHSYLFSRDAGGQEAVLPEGPRKDAPQAGAQRRAEPASRIDHHQRVRLALVEPRRQPDVPHGQSVCDASRAGGDGGAAADAPRPVCRGADGVLAMSSPGGRRDALLRPGLFAARRQAAARRGRHLRRFHRPRATHF